MLRFKPAFSLSSFTLKRLFSSSSLSAIKLVSSAYPTSIFSQQSWFQLVIHPAWHFPWCVLHRSSISRVTVYNLDILLSNWKTVHHSMSGPNCWFLISIQIFQKADKVVWYYHLVKNFLQFVVNTELKALAYSVKQKLMFFWNPLGSPMIQWRLAILSLVHLPFLQSAWMSGDSQFMYCWSQGSLQEN